MSQGLVVDIFGDNYYAYPETERMIYEGYL